jgi:hypothetical protein
LVFLAIGNNLSTTEITLRALIAIIAMAAIVLLKRAAQEVFAGTRRSRFFYGERYDLRHGLLDFGRTLSATTALDPLAQCFDGTAAAGSRRGKSRGLYRRRKRAGTLPARQIDRS